MRSLIDFFIRYNALFTFILLQIVSLSLLVNSHNYQKNRVFSAANAVSGNIYETQSGISDYFKLNEQNLALQQQNAWLLSQVATSSYRDNNEIYMGCNDSLRVAFTYSEASIIRNSTRDANNFIIINKGSKHGIKPNMGVIIPEGLVGITKEVSANFSTVISILNKNSRISVKLKKYGYSGNLEWPGTNPQVAVVNGIPKHVQIKIGDTIVTSGYSAIFPENTLVGTIKEFKIAEGSNFYDVNVTLSTNFETIKQVYIVNFLYRNELDSLTQRHNE